MPMRSDIAKALQIVRHTYGGDRVFLLEAADKSAVPLFKILVKVGEGLIGSRIED
jgi:hypothetical protein